MGIPRWVPGWVHGGTETKPTIREQVAEIFQGELGGYVDWFMDPETDVQFLLCDFAACEQRIVSQLKKTFVVPLTKGLTGYRTVGDLVTYIQNTRK